MRTRIIGIAAGFLLACILLYLFFRKSDPAEVIARIGSIDPLYLLLALTAVFAMLAVRAYRWGLFVMPLGGAGFFNLFGTMVSGFAVIFLVPGRLGEIVRPYLLARKEKLPFGAVFATIVLERIFDLIVLIVLLAFFFLALGSGDFGVELNKAAAPLRTAGFVSIALLSVLIAVFWFMKTHRTFSEKLFRFVTSFLPGRVREKVYSLFDSFVAGLSALRFDKSLINISFHSVLLWFLIALYHWFVFQGLGIEVTILGTVLIVPLIAFGTALPTPGGIGGFHYFCRIGLVHFLGAANDKAVAAAVAAHAIGWFPMAILGMVFLWKEGLDWGKIEKIADETLRSENP